MCFSHPNIVMFDLLIFSLKMCLNFVWNVWICLEAPSQNKQKKLLGLQRTALLSPNFCFLSHYTEPVSFLLALVVAILRYVDHRRLPTLMSATKCVLRGNSSIIWQQGGSGGPKMPDPVRAGRNYYFSTIFLLEASMLRTNLCLDSLKSFESESNFQ